MSASVYCLHCGGPHDFRECSRQEGHKTPTLTYLPEKLEGLAVVAGLHYQHRQAQERIAELEAEVERLNRHATEDAQADVDIQETLRKYMEDAQTFQRERDEARRELAKERARFDWYILNETSHDDYASFVESYNLGRPVPDPLGPDEWRSAIAAVRKP